MRNIFKYIAISSFALLSVSCEEDLDIVQDGTVLDEIIITKQSDMQQYLNGIYALVNNDAQIGFTAIFTDETGVGVGTGGQNFPTHRFQIDSSNPFAQTIWYENYRVINRVNRFLKYANNVTPTDVTVFNNMVAQAKVLRAHAYTELLYYFAVDMKNDASDGVMLFDFVPENYTFELPRSTVGQVAAFIENDLNSAYDNLTSTSTLFVRKAAVDAIRARFYLFRGDYTKALQYATAASVVPLTLATPVPAGLVDADLGIPQLNPNPKVTTTTVNTRHSAFASSTNPYRAMFTDASAGEIIFQINRPAAGTWSNVYDNFAFNTTNATGGLMFEVGKNLYNDMISIPGDIRKFNLLDPTSRIQPDINAIPFGDLRQRDVLVIDKYPGKGNSPKRNNYKLFRVSEMRLIIAECLARAGNLAGATDVIEAIRTARKYTPGAYTRPDFTTEEEALTAILFERKVELCFEGHRYLDLKRLGADSKVNKSIERSKADDNLENLPLTIPVGDYRYRLPIPQAEVNANPTIKQNPNY